jgi:NADPH-dependent dioxygenase
MFRHTDPEVLVVGAGPVGLTAALFLQLHGVRVEVIDEDQRTTQHSYALAIHPRTLRILDEAGTGQRANRRWAEGDEGRLLRRARAARRDRLFVPRFQASVSPRRSQSVLESAAAEALRAEKVKVLWDTGSRPSA